jgi:hypothetical protein
MDWGRKIVLNSGQSFSNLGENIKSQIQELNEHKVE